MLWLLAACPLLGLAQSGAIIIPSSGTLNGVNTVYGTASSTVSFSVSAAGLSSGLQVQAPPGFEVSIDNANFSTTVTIPNNGTIDSQPIYIRLAKTTWVGPYSGDVILSSPGAQNKSKFMPNSMVSKKQLTITADDKTRTVNTPNPVFTATYSGLVNGDGPADLDSPPVLSSPADINSPSGLYPILLDVGLDNNYSITPVNGTLTIEPDGIPNAFTPNGDGVNDYWKISSKFVQAGCVVSVYNRNGQRVFYSVGYAIPWNGTFSGQQQSSGTYYYIIDSKDGQKPQSGSVTIFR